MITALLLAATVGLNVRADVSTARVGTFGTTESVTWRAREFELESEWGTGTTPLAGFAFGLRKEGQYYDDGTYLTLRAFGRVTLAPHLGLYPSFGLVYGLPGPLMMRSHDGIWVFPVRTIDIPGTEVRGDGILYPELSAALRFRLWRFTLEPLAGLRWIRFGAARAGDYREQRVLVPTVGFRVGFSLTR